MPGKTSYKNHKKAKTSRGLGSVRELSDKWGLTEQLQKGEVLGPPFREVLECAVEISKRAKILAGTAPLEGFIQNSVELVLVAQQEI